MQLHEKLQKESLQDAWSSTELWVRDVRSKAKGVRTKRVVKVSLETASPSCHSSSLFCLSIACSFVFIVSSVGPKCAFESKTNNRVVNVRLKISRGMIDTVIFVAHSSFIFIIYRLLAGARCARKPGGCGQEELSRVRPHTRRLLFSFLPSLHYTLPLFLSIKKITMCVRASWGTRIR